MTVVTVFWEIVVDWRVAVDVLAVIEVSSVVAPVVDGNIVDDDNNNEESDVVDISAPIPILLVLEFLKTNPWFS